VTIWIIRQKRREVETLRSHGIFTRVNGLGVVGTFYPCQYHTANIDLSQSSVGSSERWIRRNRGP
jgi:hypothetical protein